jgi:hypothetical protein
MEEVTKLQSNTRNEDTDQEGNGKQSGQETVTSVIEEINERKSRQNNMVVFGTEEKKSSIELNVTIIGLKFSVIFTQSLYNVNMISLSCSSLSSLFSDFFSSVFV